MYAIIATGGKQYKVQEGQTLRIEKMPVKEGEILNLDVMLSFDQDAKDVKLGRPVLAGAQVSARVLSHGLHDKIEVVKYKPKVRYTRRRGHRQPFTAIKVESIKS